MSKPRPTICPSRRAALLGALAAPLAGCQAPYGIGLDALKTSAVVALGLQNAPGITLEEASKTPFASIAFRVGDSSESMMILATDTAGVLLWTSAEHQALVTQGGRLIKTAGLKWNLDNTSFHEKDPLAAGLEHGVPSTSTTRYSDFGDIHLYGITIESHFKQIGIEDISILGTTFSDIHIAEYCRAKEIGWEFKNDFWIDPNSGFVWRSQQTVHPNQPPINIDILRPPS